MRVVHGLVWSALPRYEASAISASQEKCPPPVSRNTMQWRGFLYRGGRWRTPLRALTHVRGHIFHKTMKEVSSTVRRCVNRVVMGTIEMSEMSVGGHSGPFWGEGTLVKGLRIGKGCHSPKLGRCTGR